ncbi:MAG: PKD domain-containing protein, partial [candidate division Zixibacteria bacterium]
RLFDHNVSGFCWTGIASGCQDIVFDDKYNRLLVGSWTGNPPIQAISLEDSICTNVVDNSPGYCDGITVDGKGNTFVSSYDDDGSVWMYDSVFTEPPTLITTLPTEPSGLWYNRETDILCIPDFTGKVWLVNVYVGFDSDTSYGAVPLEVNFSGDSRLTAESWYWDFGDGNTATDAAPTHTYNDPGYYDVLVQVTSDGETYTYTNLGCIAVLADTLSADDVEGDLASTVELTVSAINNVPLHTLQIPVVYSGPLTLSLADLTTSGCRTDGFDISYIHFSGSTKKFTVVLSTDDATPLEVGSGPIMKLSFDINNASGGKTNLIDFSGYDTHEPLFQGSWLDYPPELKSGTVSLAGCCIGMVGNVNNDPGDEVDISDLTALVNYLFVPPNTEPGCLSEANISGDPGCHIDISDLTALVNHLFVTFDPLPDCLSGC